MDSPTKLEWLVPFHYIKTNVPNTFVIIHFHSHSRSPIYIDTYLFSGNDSGGEEHPPRGILPKELSPRLITQSLARISYT